MILKFKGVTGIQLAQLQEFADSTYKAWHNPTGGGSQTHRVVKILKTTAGEHRGETSWVVELDISQRRPTDSQGFTKAYRDTSRDVVDRILDILGHFPRAEPDDIVLEPREALHDEDVELSVSTPGESQATDPPKPPGKKAAMPPPGIL